MWGGRLQVFGCVTFEFKPCQLSLSSAEVVNESAFSHSDFVKPGGQITARNFLKFKLLPIDLIYFLVIITFISSWNMAPWRHHWNSCTELVDSLIDGKWSFKAKKKSVMCSSCALQFSEGRSVFDVMLMNLQKHMPIQGTHALTFKHTSHLCGDVWRISS